MNGGHPREENEAPGSDDEIFDQTDADATRERLRSRGSADAAVTAGGGAKEDWKSFDVSKAMTALRHPDQAARLRTLQRLHVRWYHATAAQMTGLLKAAGAPADAVLEVKTVCAQCLVCRDWHRPGPHNVATFKLSLAFNEEVQFDLMFYHSLLQPRRGNITILHLVDCCIRWDAACVLAGKEEDTLVAVAFAPLHNLVA